MGEKIFAGREEFKEYGSGGLPTVFPENKSKLIWVWRTQVAPKTYIRLFRHCEGTPTETKQYIVRVFSNSKTEDLWSLGIVGANNGAAQRYYEGTFDECRRLAEVLVMLGEV